MEASSAVAVAESSAGTRRTDDAIKVWQRRYCEYHVSQGGGTGSHTHSLTCAAMTHPPIPLIDLGHAGFCYAWLDNAFCPQYHLTGSCRMLHEHPSSWTAAQKAQHNVQIDYMRDLWKDSVLYEDVGDGDSDGDDDGNDGPLPPPPVATEKPSSTRAGRERGAAASRNAGGGHGNETSKRRRTRE